MIKNLISLLPIFCLACNIASSQAYFKILTDNFSSLVNCYNWVDEDGNPITPEEMKPRKVKALRKIDDADSPIKKPYPIFIYLVTHMRESLYEEAKPCSACEALKAAVEEVELLKARGFASMKKLDDYQKNFGIDTAFIYGFYNSSYCKFYGIERGTDCEKLRSDYEKKTKQDEVKESNPINFVQPEVDDIEPNNKNYKPESGCSMLRKALAKDLLKRDHLEISELPIGDTRRIPEVKGAQYEVRFKREDNKKLLYFEPSWYIIPDRSQHNPNDNFWDLYATAVKEFKTLVLDILEDEDIGEKGFQIFLQGSADSPIFSPKQLMEGYDTDFFQNIRLLKVDSQDETIKEATLLVGETYDNEELPNLRAAFLKFVLLQMDGMRELGSHLHIFKGNVKAFKDEQKRSCFVILVVDWDVVEAKIKAMEHLNQQTSN